MAQYGRIGHIADYTVNDRYYVNNIAYADDENKYLEQLLPDRLGPSVDTSIIGLEAADDPATARGGMGIITVAKPNTGVDSDDHLLVSLPVRVEVRKCIKNFAHDVGVYEKPITLPFAAKLWCDAYTVKKGELEILNKFVNLTEYRIITGDVGATYMGSWVCAAKFSNALTKLTMDETDCVYSQDTPGQKTTNINICIGSSLYNTPKNSGWRLPKEDNPLIKDGVEEWINFTGMEHIICAGCEGHHIGATLYQPVAKTSETHRRPGPVWLENVQAYYPHWHSIYNAYGIDTDKADGTFGECPHHEGLDTFEKAHRTYYGKIPEYSLVSLHFYKGSYREDGDYYGDLWTMPKSWSNAYSRLQKVNIPFRVCRPVQ